MTLHEINATINKIYDELIDNIYDELAELVALRSSPPDPVLENQIRSLTEKLRSLQKQESDLVREYTRAKVAGPIAKGLEILRRADEILERQKPQAGCPRASDGKEKG